MSNVVRWKEEPEAHDYPAAAAFLGLIAKPDVVDLIVEGLRKAPIEHYQAKDILRASGLPLLPLDNVHVAKDVARLKSGKALSPVLLVRGDLTRAVPVQVADGYHRVCASFHLDEDMDIPCRTASLPAPR
jgi:hypothetical protein